MSILVSESYANPDTPLWIISSSQVSDQTATILIPPGSSNLYFGYPDSQGLAFYTDPASYSIVGGSYIATFSFYIYYIETSSIPTTTLLPIIFTMYAVNSLGTFQSGIEYFYDTTSPNPVGYTATISMPFVSDGTDAGLSIYIYNPSTVDITIDIVPVATSLLYLGTAISQAQIFSPV